MAEVDLDAVRADLWAVVDYPLIRRDVNWYAAIDRLAAAVPALVAEVDQLRGARGVAVQDVRRDVRRDVGGHCVGCDASEREFCTQSCPERAEAAE